MSGTADPSVAPGRTEIEIAGIAHDLRNVLAVILAAADALALSLAAGAADRLSTSHPGLESGCSFPSAWAFDEDVGAIRTAVRRGGELTRRLMRPQEPATQHSALLSVDTAVADIAALLARLMPDGIQLECSGATGGRALAMDGLDFERVVMNLVLNARDSMRKGVVSLHIDTLTLTVAEAALSGTVPPGRYVTIDVNDQGCGILPETLARIGNPYVTTKAAQGGTGLGLATVCRIVSGVRGFMRVRSLPEQGTRIRLYFPFVEVDRGAECELAPAATPFCEDPSPQPNCGTVLLVDDDDVLRHLAVRALRAAGWTVLEAETAEKALEAVRVQPEGALAALVSDLALPDMDGVALIATLRTLPGAARLPAVLMSGYRPDTAAMSDIAYLEKPYSMNELVAKLATLTTLA